MRKSWALASIGLLAFAVLVWFAGPLLVIGGQVPLAAPLMRALVVAVFVLQYVAQKLWSLQVSRRNNERLVADLKPAAEPASSAEQVQLRERFIGALAELRQMRFGGGARASLAWRFSNAYLYELPWYMIIGAPGAGKTTALLNSGLDFPLANKLGRGSVAGFGGTRNCDWWFTDRAILIDTAGRYTTQDSDRVGDKQAWESFLELLRRSRPRRPLNGVLIAVSVGDLLGFNPAQLTEHASVLRARLDELQSALRMRVPVYVLITKCDLLPGFVDWFDVLERKDREQVWGVTFDLRAANSGASTAEFAQSFARLVDRLGDDLVGRLQGERDAQRRARILSLPLQLHALNELLDGLVRRAFGSGQASDTGPVFLRGVYLTSATQQGSPIDRMLSAYGRELGLEQQILAPQPRSGKSFFLPGVLNSVVLAEADLSGQTPLRQRWQKRLLFGCIALLQVCAVVIAAWWLSGYFQAAAHIAARSGELTQVQAVVRSLPAQVDSNPRTLLPVLDATFALAGEPASAAGMELIDMGSRSRQKLAAGARGLYERMLLGPFQRQIADALDATLRTGVDTTVQYEALKTYAMLNDPTHFDALGFETFVLSYWDAALAPALTAAERQDLTAHLRALVRAGAVGSGIQLQRDLVGSVQARLQAEPVPQRIALRVRVLLELHPLDDFSVATVSSSAAALFVGADGESEPQSVPGRLTLAAFQDVVSPQAPVIATQLSGESSWVLGVAAVPASADAAAYLGTYRAEYAQAWTQLLDDVHLRAATSNQEAIHQAELLGSAESPLTALLKAVVQQTPAQLANGAEGPIARTDPSAVRFAALAAPHDDVLKAFKELQALRSPGAPITGILGTPESRLARVVANAKGEPEPVRSLLLTLAVLPASGPAAPPTGSALSRQVAAKLTVPCLKVVAGKFPFDRRSSEDAPLEEFGRLFAPKGVFDGVFQQLLMTRVDTSSDTWHATSSSGPEENEVERFRAAARIRDVMFAGGGTRPGLQLTFWPVDMDDSIDRFELKADGQSVRYAHGPLVPTVLKWPSASGGARIEMTPATGDAALEFTGPWALFRLLDHAAIQESGTPGHFHVVFEIGGRRASFDVESSSGANPFRLRELERFNCPIAGR